MGYAWGFLERLAALGHRGSATRAERAVSDDLAEWLKEAGFTVRLQPFLTPRDTLYLGPAAVMLGFLAAAFLGRTLPWAGLIMCGVLIAPMLGELVGSRWLDFDWLLPRYPSQNVVAELSPDGEELSTLVIAAHYDTQRGSLLFHPRVVGWLQLYFGLVYLALLCVPVGLAGAWLQPGNNWSGWVIVAGVTVLGLSAAFLLLCRLTGRYINGANDNGSGVALALALARRFGARPLPATRLIILLTGAEEVGTRGMKAFLREVALDRGSTCFINLDNLGAGTLHYLKGEGMLAYHRYSAGLASLACKVAAERGLRISPRGNLLLPTDGRVPAGAGYEAITFIAFGADGGLPHYHWYTDTIEHVDAELLHDVEQFLAEFVERAALRTGIGTEGAG